MLDYQITKYTSARNTEYRKQDIVYKILLMNEMTF